MVCGTCEHSSCGWEVPPAVCNSSARLNAHPLPGLAREGWKAQIVPGGTRFWWVQGEFHNPQGTLCLPYRQTCTSCTSAAATSLSQPVLLPLCFVLPFGTRAGFHHFFTVTPSRIDISALPLQTSLGHAQRFLCLLNTPSTAPTPPWSTARKQDQRETPSPPSEPSPTSLQPRSPSFQLYHGEEKDK